MAAHSPSIWPGKRHAASLALSAATGTPQKNDGLLSSGAFGFEFCPAIVESVDLGLGGVDRCHGFHEACRIRNDFSHLEQHAICFERLFRLRDLLFDLFPLAVLEI